jgi:hypothetical protein
MIQTRTTNTHPTAAEVEREWLALGFQPGGPAHVPPAIVDVDERVGKTMKCGACHRRGMKFIPLRRGTAYRVVLLCRCGNHEEL